MIPPRCSARSTTAAATPMATSRASPTGTSPGWPRRSCRYLAEDQEPRCHGARRRSTAFGPRSRRPIWMASAQDRPRQEQEGDAALAQDLLERMAANHADFTLTFRRLGERRRDRRVTPTSAASSPILAPMTNGPGAGAGGWARRPVAPAARRAAMRAVNPAVIPRNHLVEEALAAAVKSQDFAPFDELLEVTSRPYEDRPEFAARRAAGAGSGHLPDFLRDLSRRPRLLRGTAGAARIIGRPPGLAAGQGSILFCHIECGPIIPMGKAAAWQERHDGWGQTSTGGANFWRRAAAEVDASLLGVKRYAPAPRRGPAVSTISAREEADSNLRWARVQRREKLRGPVTITETLSLGLGAAALAAYASHGIPGGSGTIRSISTARLPTTRLPCPMPGPPHRCNSGRRDGSPRHRKQAGLDPLDGRSRRNHRRRRIRRGGRRAARPSSPPPSCGPRARPMAWPGARLRPVPAHSPPA